jgi:citrate lyase beta subunit
VKKAKAPGKTAGETAVEELMLDLEHAIATSEVKTATPTRVGRSVQVRVAWRTRDGKHGLGYISRHSSHSSTFSTKDFIYEVYRVEKFIKAAYEKYGRVNDEYASAYDLFVRETLNSSTIMHAQSRAHELRWEAQDKINRCKANKEPDSLRLALARKKAREYIGNAVLFAKKNGISDDEINELLNLAFVRHTMES